MLFSTLSAIAFASSALAAPSVASRSVAAPKAEFEITSVGVIGTGCPPGTAYVAVSDDNTALTAVFSEFQAVAGPGVPLKDNRKACRLTLGVKIPKGYNFGLKSIDSAGYYQLDKDVTATQGSYYYFQGEVAQANARTTYTGPIPGKAYINKETYDQTSTVRSPCGGEVILNISNDVRVNNSKNKDGEGAIAKDLVNFKQTLHVDWRAC